MTEQKTETGKEKKIEPVSDRRSILYEIARVVAWILFHTIMPTRCFHRERLKAEAPYILIANHQHALDPVLMAMNVPGRQIVFLAKKELAKSPFVENLLTRLHCIMVNRHHMDMAAMRSCMKAVKKKKILLIFPEGTRHHQGQMEQIESGTAMITLRSGAPIIPIYIDRPLKCFRMTHMTVGEPIPYDDLLARGINAQTCEEMNERFRETYRKMIRENS